MLDPLRLHRRECEERRRFVGDLQELAERLRADAARVCEEIACAPVALAPLRERHAKLENSLAEVERQIAAAGEALAAAEDALNRQQRAFIDRRGNLSARPPRRPRPPILAAAPRSGD